MHRFVIAPNEQARETPFIEHNIKATRKAFALDDVEEREVSGDALLTRADIDANDATLGNVRLWDHEPLLQTFAQIQEIRTYYDFVSVHNDRYMIDGAVSADHAVGARAELRQPAEPQLDQRAADVHARLRRHAGAGESGHAGRSAGAVHQGSSAAVLGDLKVDEPSIYYGQQSNDYVFVQTNAREFHYPKGEDNVYTTYEGTGGVPVSSFLRRLLFSIRFRSFKVLLSEDITNESRVMFHRRLSERVARIAPFLRVRPGPVPGHLERPPVLAAGRLHGQRPLSLFDAGANGINYIRNSVKATVDAYHGTVAFYLIDDKDPIALTLQRIFPTLFRPLAEMPEDMRTRLRYPEGIFALQAAMYATYHMTNPAVFYNKEDLWEVPTALVRSRSRSSCSRTTR